MDKPTPEEVDRVLKAMADLHESQRLELHYWPSIYSSTDTSRRDIWYSNADRAELVEELCSRD